MTLLAEMLAELKRPPQDFVQIAAYIDGADDRRRVRCFPHDMQYEELVGSFHTMLEAQLAATELRAHCRAARRLLGLPTPWLKP